MTHREFKDRAYGQFARIGAAMSSEKRLELLDLLAQAPRNVEVLAAESDMSTANTSRHLQALKAARLVDTERDGTKVIYRLAGDDVLDLWLALRLVAEAHLAEVSHLHRAETNDAEAPPPMSRDDLAAAVHVGDVLLIDVRPAIEYEHGHLPEAVSMPIDSFAGGLETLPMSRRIVVYCRGRYCRFADEAVAVLRGAGFDAVRLEGGWPEWRAEGRPVARSAVP
jgi:rhodanese-related sulfurtransferase